MQMSSVFNHHISHAQPQNDDAIPDIFQYHTLIMCSVLYIKKDEKNTKNMFF